MYYNYYCVLVRSNMFRRVSDSTKSKSRSKSKRERERERERVENAAKRVSQ